MTTAPDPFETYLKRAAGLFDAGDIVQAGQIWQAILKKNPNHETARAGLYKVKLYFDARATQDGLAGRKITEAAADLQAPRKTEDPEIARLLEQGCTLYDAGHVEDALTKWMQVLAKDPENILAKGYISGVHRSLPPAAGIKPEEPRPPVQREPAVREPAPEPPAPVKAAAPLPATPTPAAVTGEELDRLLRDGCTLFDMGQVEDALKKWEQILARDPGHALARAYVLDARKDLGLPLDEVVPVMAPSAPAVPTEAQPVVAEDERLSNLIRDGVQLYDMGMVQEACQKWQEVLVLVPGHGEAQAYLAMAKRDQEATVARKAPAPAPAELSGRDLARPQARPQAAIQAAPIEMALPRQEPAAHAPEPVTPPPALTAGAQISRKGLNLPELLRNISLPAWMASPAFILGTICGLVVLVVGSYYFMQHRKDEALRQSVAAFRANAVAPVLRGTEVPSLEESPDGIRQEAEAALGGDPLLAYFRAQELARRTPGDAVAAQLLERAKAGLGKGELVPATPADYAKQLQKGALEEADRSMTTLLNANPDDRILREQAGRLYGILAQAFAAKEQWSEAEEYLHRGRAMFPADKSWSARLRLLETIQSMAKKDRQPWIQLLG